MRPAASNPAQTLREQDRSTSGAREATSDSTELPVDDPGRYQIKGELAEGGLGRVLQAVDVRLGRTVALKELLRRSSLGEARFVQEALITARLQHPGIVPVHEAGRWPSGEPYYVMKLISGQSLKELIAVQTSVEARLALLPHVIAIAETIAYAHSERVLHRDIKPSNVVVGEYGETVVVDWGIAKELLRPSEDESMPLRHASPDSSATLGVVGTPAFMAPEQASGGIVDERSDVYALGAVLYNVLSGKPPYQGDSSDAVVQRVLEGPPAPLAGLEPRLPQDLVAIADKAMARDPATRYGTARQFVSDLKRFQTGQLVRAYNYGTFTLLRRWITRYRAAVSVAALGLALLVMGALVSINRIIQARVVAEQERSQAEVAQASTEARRVELIFLQAKSSLSRDPTATLAWLKLYPAEGSEFGALGPMIEDARSRGVARHVLPHGDWVYEVAFSPDGRKLASASQDGRVRLFSVTTGTERVLGTHQASVQALVFSRDGHWLATGDQEGRIIVWDLMSNTERVLQGHSGLVDLLLFGKDDEMLFSGGVDKTVRTWDTKTGSQLSIFEDTKRRVGAFAPDGTAIVVALSDGEVQVVDPLSGWRTRLGNVADVRHAALAPADPLFGARRAGVVDGKGRVWVLNQGERKARELGEHPGTVTWFRFSPSGRWLVSAGEDHVVRVWDAVDDKHRVLRGHEDAVYHAVFSDDERALVSASDDATARLWRLETGVSHVLRGHTDDVYRVAISKDGAHVATASLDATVRVWVTRFDDSRSLVAEPCAAGCGVHASADGRHVVSFAAERNLLVHDLDTGQSRTIAALGATHPKKPTISVSERGDFAALASGELGTTDLYDLRTGQHRRLGQTGSLVTGLRLSPDGMILVSGSTDGTLRRWDTETGSSTPLSAGVIPLEGVLSAAQNEVVFATGQDLRVLDLHTGKIKYQVGFDQVGEGFAPVGMAVSADGQMVAVRGEDATLVWDIRTGQLRELTTGGHRIIDISLSPDGEWLALAVADRTVHVWSLITGKKEILRGHTDLVMQVRFSPDSKLLASSSYDKTVRLWERDSWRSRALRGHAESVDGIAFSPNGAKLYSASRDGTLRIWDVHASASSSSDTRSRLNLTSAVVTKDGVLTSL